MKNLSIKNFLRNTLLGATPDTYFLEIDPVVEQVKGENLLSDAEKTVTIPELKCADKVNIFMICQIKSCSKIMPYVVNCKVFTCANCSTSQKVTAAKTVMSARLCAEIDGQDTWFTARISALLHKLIIKFTILITRHASRISIF